MTFSLIHVHFMPRKSMPARQISILLTRSIVTIVAIENRPWRKQLFRGHGQGSVTLLVEKNMNQSIMALLEH
jgi:hypothetical protein